MNCNTIITGIICCFVLNANAQYVGEENDDDVGNKRFLSQSYIGLNLGFSNPVGDYGSDSRVNQDASFAKMGYHISLTYSKLLSENIGITVLAGRSASEMDDQKIESILQETYPISTNPPYNLVEWNVSAGSYSTNSFLGGLLIALPMSNGFFDMRILMGYAISTLPSIVISVDDGNIFEEQIQKSSTNGAFAMNIGAGLRLNLNNELSLALNVDWYRTEPTFDQIVESNFGYSSIDTYTMTMTMLNPSIGIGYRFY